MARQQRAADKLQKRLQKKPETVGGTTEQRSDIEGRTDEEYSQPGGLDFHDF